MASHSNAIDLKMVMIVMGKWYSHAFPIAIYNLMVTASTRYYVYNNILWAAVYSNIRLGFLMGDDGILDFIPAYTCHVTPMQNCQQQTQNETYLKRMP